MTHSDVIEHRLRATFRAVAEQPVAPVAVDEEPWRAGVARPAAPRRSRALLGAVAAVVTVAVVALGVAYGPRSSTTTTSPAPPGASHVIHAVFAPVTHRSHAALELAAATMRARLRSLGDHHDTVTVRGGSIEVSGDSISPSQLRIVTAPGAFTVRPVLCGAPASVPGQPGSQAATLPTLPTCGAAYTLSAANLDVNTNTGQPATAIPADPAFAAYPSTPARRDDPSASVLLPGDPSVGAQEYPRFALGPAQLGGSDIAGASARPEGPGAANQWSVVITLKPSSATAWDAVAEVNFHRFVAFDLDGAVLEAPLMQPNATAFSSFEGKIEMAYFSAAEAKSLAAVLDSGPLPILLRLESVSRSALP